MRIADSSGLVGAKPLAVIAAAFAALPQLSLVAITTWSDWRTRLSVGLASAFAMPNGTSDGPVATIATCCGPLPWITKPPIITSLPVNTWPRVEMLMSGISGWSTSYTATIPTPVPPTPETIAVYAPGASVVRMADSSGFDGAKPLEVIAAALAALPQLSLVASTTWSDWRTRLNVGLASALAMPNGMSDGT